MVVPAHSAEVKEEANEEEREGKGKIQELNKCIYRMHETVRIQNNSMKSKHVGDFSKWKFLINKTNKQAKYSQKYWNGEQTDSNQRGSGRLWRGEEVEGFQEQVQRTHEQNQRRVGLGVGSEDGWSGGSSGGEMEITVLEQQF